MPTTVTKTIRASGGDYTTLSGWEAGRQAVNANLVTADVIEVGECYDDWASGLDDSVGIDGFTTDSTRYLKITVASGHRHNGTPGSGFFISKSAGFATLFTVADSYTRLEYLDARNTATSGDTHVFRFTASDCIATACIAKNARSDAGCFIGSATLNACLAWEAAGRGFVCENFNYMNANNCVASECGTGFLRVGPNGDFTAKNCVAYANTTNYSGTFHANSTHNATSTGSDDAPGGNSVISVASGNFVDAANNDFHLATGTNSLVGAGTNLYSTFTTDIDGDTWPSSGAWDIGFDYRVAGGGATTVQCNPSTVVVSGQQATIVESAAATAIECSAAIVPVTGAQATVVAPTHIAATAGTVPVTGTQATVVAQTNIAATAGTVPVIGQQATIVSRTHIAASPATVVVNGQQASITQILAGAVECSAATVPVTGQPATIIEYSRVVCSPATVPVTGQQATLLQRSLVPSTAATVAVTGQQATIVGAALTTVECSAATVLVAGQQATVDSTEIVTTRIECSPSTVAVIGGTGNVVSISGLRSRRNRGRYVTYTEPTAGEPLPKLPHAPRRKARLADVLEFVPTPEPDRVEPTPAKVEAKPAVITKPKAKLSPEMELLAEEVTRRVVAALMPLLASGVEDAEDEEELIKLLLSRFAA